MKPLVNLLVIVGGGKNKGIVFCFDIDDTLIKTNLANFLAYQKAIADIKNITISPNLLQKRCDKDLLNSLNLNTQESKKIKILKDRYFYEFLSYTAVNHILYGFMRLLQKSYDVILITNAQKIRIESLIKHHHLNTLPAIFYNKNGNKYKNCIELFSLNATSMVIFEDSDKDIQYAKEMGIINIIKV